MEETKYENEASGLKIGIEEMQRNLEAQFEGIDAIKAFARTIFGAASLIVSLISTLGLIETNISDNIKPFYYGILLTTGILYVFLIILCLWVLSPIRLDLPIKADWKVMYDYLMGDEITVLRTHLYAYITTIQDNVKYIEPRERWVKWSGALLGLIVILLLILSSILIN